MNLINLPQPPQKTSARNMAENLLLALNQNLQQRIEAHRVMFDAFWKSQDAPDDILSELNAMGAAGLLLASASENVDHIGRLAALVGKQVTDFLPAEEWQPKRAFVANVDGTFSLEPPADGFDAWGNPIAQD